jgi:hypothetical protein
LTRKLITKSGILSTVQSALNARATDAEEEELARISLKKFVNDISRCPDCKNNPFFFLSSKKVPVCMKHWNMIADEPVAWTEEGKITLLAEV